MDPLASGEDVAVQLGRDLTDAEQARVDDILVKASDLFRRASRQNFTPGTSTVRLQPQGGRVRLEQAPATEVTTVVDDAGADVDHDLDGQWLTVTRNGCPLDEYVTVTYDHGGEVPDLVRITIAEIVAKVLRIDPRAAAGASTGTRSAGSYSETEQFAGWAVGGTTMLSPDDRAVAESFRYRGTRTIVCRP